MQKKWVDSKVDVYLNDSENDRSVRQRFNGVVEAPTVEQIAAFIGAIDSVSALPTTQGIVVEQYSYTV
ncbi:hypothetical protein [Marinilactibacillus kalidii]|uniref:DUF1659 domain-containing protein n=1 Tax=Marinilactibacillus kalidii TaxID=2820274 RepID=UPI001ABEE681|nr:hypothetical protein [Marinilactibacillus kalidii]